MLLWTLGCLYVFELQFCLNICPGDELLDYMEISTFMVSCLIFKSLSHFELVCMWYKDVFQLDWFTCSCNFPNTICWRDCLFLHYTLLPSLSKISWAKCVGSFPFHWPRCLFLCQYHAVFISVPCSVIWSLRRLCFYFALFPQDCLVIQALMIRISILGLLVLVLWKISWVIW